MIKKQEKPTQKYWFRYDHYIDNSNTTRSNKMSKATSVKQAREMILEQYRVYADTYTFYREQAVSNELVFAPLTPESCKERAERYCDQLLALGNVLEGVFGVSYDTLLDIEFEESRKNRAILQAAKG